MSPLKMALLHGAQLTMALVLGGALAAHVRRAIVEERRAAVSVARELGLRVFFVGEMADAVARSAALGAEPLGSLEELRSLTTTWRIEDTIDGVHVLISPVRRKRGRKSEPFVRIVAGHGIRTGSSFFIRRRSLGLEVVDAFVGTRGVLTDDARFDEEVFVEADDPAAMRRVLGQPAARDAVRAFLALDRDATIDPSGLVIHQRGRLTTADDLRPLLDAAVATSKALST